MIRKLVKQGNGAYTLTLPKAWVIKNELDQSLEVEIDELEQDLILKSNNKNESLQLKSISLNLDLYTKENYRSIIGSLYRFGYDEIYIKFKDQETISSLEESINSLFGLELFFENKNQCIIRSIYANEKTQVHSHILRMIYSIHMMQETIIKDLKKQELDSLNYLTELRNNVLKQRDLILRIIKKQKLLDDQTFPYYTIALSLWSIARNYFHMYKHLDVADKKHIKLIEESNEYFNTSFLKLHALNENKLLENHHYYSKVFSKLTKKLTESKALSFSLNVAIETQLAQSSLYILSISHKK